MDIIMANIPFIIVLIILVMELITSFKNGAIKDIFSFFSMIIASVLVLLIAFGIRKYFEQERILFVITLVLLALLTITYKVLNLFFDTLKIISKLPVINFINKILTIPLAIAETVVIVWAVYCIIMVMDAGSFGTWIMDCVKINPIMKFLYQYNYMYGYASRFSSTLADIDIWAKLGM